ncbi:MAG TPA: hypothetical protein VF755_09330 [Catenuloplanes sp.]|jgi:hypothetical protein
MPPHVPSPNGTAVRYPSIRAVIDPSGTSLPANHRPPAPRGVRDLLTALTGFYKDPGARLALILSTVILCYGGGAVMFWFHAVYLAEGGPAISWVAHWLLDSSFAFAALTPVLVVILPIAAWLTQSFSGAIAPRFIPWLYAVIGGTVFAITTTPGPIAHDMFVGRGTWLAGRVTELIGDPSATLPPVADYPLLAALAQQLGAGLPLYIALMALTVLLLRLVARPSS